MEDLSSDQGSANVKVGQINLHKSHHSKVELVRRDYDITLVQEPPYNKRGISITRSQGTFAVAQGRARAAIVCKNNVIASMVTDYSGLDICTVQIKIRGRISMVSSVYMDINKSVRCDILTGLIRYCRAGNIPLLIGMDSNAHSSSWGSKEDNARGLELEEFLLEEDLHLLNRGNTPTFVQGKKESIIDLTVINSEMLSLDVTRDWYVDTNASFSDHRYLTFRFEVTVRLTEASRNLKGANWQTFREILQRKGRDLPDTENLSVEDLDNSAGQLNALIIGALDEIAPMERRAPDRGNRWWNDHLEDLRSKVRRLKGQNRKNPRRARALAELSREYRTEIRKARDASFKNFCSSISSPKDIAGALRAIRKPFAPKSVLIKDSNGNDPEGPKDSLQNMVAAHFPDFSQTPPDEGDGGGEGVIPIDISISRVKAALGSFGKFKSAGPDGIAPVVLQNVDEGTLFRIQKIYEISLRAQRVPKEWLKMRVIFIPKEGKTEYGSAKSYRPITLSSFLLKGLERLLKWHLEENFLAEPLLFQHAYTTGRSTETALSEIVHQIENSVLKGGHAVAVSLDCSGAFDNIKFDSASQGLRQLGVEECIISWYNHLLSNREVQVEENGEEMTFFPTRGSPQGGVLSPTIWNIVMNDLLKRFRYGPANLTCYADDVCIVIKGYDLKALITHAQRALNITEAWGSRQGINFQGKKSQAMIISRSVITGSHRKLVLKGEQLVYKEEIKHLGLIIDSRLNWKANLKYRVAKAKKNMLLARILVGKNWGLSFQKCLWIYLSIVRPMISYGCIVWSHSLSSGSILTLRRIQRLAILMMTQCMRSTPTEGAEAVLGLMPLDYFCQETATVAYTRIRSQFGLSGENPIRGRFKSHREFHLARIPNEIREGQPQQLKVKKILPVESDPRVGENPVYTAYTDGSKMEDRVGYGFFVAESDDIVYEEAGRLDDHATVYMAEVFALTSLLSLILLRKDFRGKTFRIFSDCFSGLTAIEETIKNDQTIYELCVLLHKARRIAGIDLKWVRGHSGNTGNEYADTLAKKGTGLELRGPLPVLPFPRSLVKEMVHEFYVERWNWRWFGHRGEKYRQSHLAVPVVNTDKLRFLANSHFTRGEIDIMMQMMTGHARLSRHLSQWRQIDPGCRLCGEEGALETPYHIVAECGACTQTRREILVYRDSLERKSEGIKDILCSIRVGKSKKVKDLWISTN